MTKFKADEEEYEDSEGNVLSKKTFEGDFYLLYNDSAWRTYIYFRFKEARITLMLRISSRFRSLHVLYLFSDNFPL